MQEILQPSWNRTLKIWDKIIFFAWTWRYRSSSSIDWISWCASILDTTTWQVISLWEVNSFVAYWNVVVQLVSSYIDWNIININFNNWYSGAFRFKIDTQNNTFIVGTGNITTWTLDNSTSQTISGKTYQTNIDNYGYWYSAYLSIA